jgi:hypothetical protein
MNYRQVFWRWVVYNTPTANVVAVFSAINNARGYCKINPFRR